MEEQNVRKKSCIWKVIGVIFAIWAAIAAGCMIARYIYKKKDEKNEGSEIGQHFSFMNGKKIVVDGETFKGVTFKGIMSGCSIDLMGAKFEKESFISLNVLMCGVDIKVPKDVKVVADGMCKSGSVSDRTDHTDDESKDKVLYVAYDAKASGISIRNGEED
ncbi:MAG: hypothetical protein ILP10_03500 [Lachnospiraceae bacterium]|nr:hypothetical protein [Lachnospiraceae bacterium]